MKKKLLLLSIAVLCFASFASADNFVIYGSRAAQNPTDFFDWSQIAAPGTIVSSPQSVTSFSGSNTALVGNIDGSPFVTVQEDGGNTWLGSFDFGESLLWTGNSNLGFAGLGPMAVAFANPVWSFGFAIQADFYGPFDAFVVALDSGGIPLFAMVASGVSNGNENGSALFLGMGDITGGNISTIEFSIVSDAGPSGLANNDFAIDAVSIGKIGTPEPGSLVLLGSGLVGIAWVLRRKLAS